MKLIYPAHISKILTVFFCILCLGSMAEAANTLPGATIFEEAPEDIVLNSYEIRENRDPGSGSIGVGDFIDDQGNSILYELVPGPGSDDNNSFQIAKKTRNSQLQAIQTFDFE
ncbi:MAG: hypothetical protein RIG62_27630, partial [Cyclobacteriaceae bacterium]